MMQTNQISILGCGWLGLPLAVFLSQKEYTIKGSTTSIEKTEILKGVGIRPFLIQLNEKRVVGDIINFLKGSRVLIINVPPGMRGDSPVPFSSKLENLINHIINSEIEKVIFVSSTSVFGNFQGEVDENTKPLPDTSSGKDLLMSEQLLMSRIEFNTAIVRFGGLIGEDRHPVYYLAGRENLKGGNAPVNLIHQKDCIGIIYEIINQKVWGKIYHGVFPEHPLKKEYYLQKAKSLNVQTPAFLEEDISGFKTVVSKTATEILHYQFQKSI